MQALGWKAGGVQFAGDHRHVFGGFFGIKRNRHQQFPRLPSRRRIGLALNFCACVVRRRRFAYKFFMADSFRLKDQPAGERPRERLVARGPDCSDTCGVDRDSAADRPAGANVVQVAPNIWQKFGSLNALALATVDELKQIAASARTRRRR